MTDHYAVMGNPIAHSLSPVIHTEFAKETEQDISYIRLEVPLNQFAEHVHQFQQQHGKGSNVTIPFKQEAFLLATTTSNAAQIAQAVNTLSFLPDGEIQGDNTDGIGLIRDLCKNHHYVIKDKRILILGAGGAVRGILLPLLEQAPQEIVIANRTFEVAVELTQRMANYGEVTAKRLDELDEPYDLIINGTSVSLATAAIHFKTCILSKDSFCYDLMYGQEPTPFLKWALHHGVQQVSDGIGMLVEQAAESFYIWRRVRPDTKTVINLLQSRAL